MGRRFLERSRLANDLLQFTQVLFLLVHRKQRIPHQIGEQNVSHFQNAAGVLGFFLYPTLSQQRRGHGFAKLARRTETILFPERYRLQNHLSRGFRQSRPQNLRRMRFRFFLRHQMFQRRRERLLPGQNFIGANAQRISIRRGRGLARKLLRSHVGIFAGHLRLLSAKCRILNPGNAKVNDLGVLLTAPVLLQHDVFRRKVPMPHAFFMRRAKRVPHLPQYVGCPGKFKRPRGGSLPQILTFDELHHQKLPPFSRLPGVKRPHHTRMIDARQRLHLLQKLLADPGVLLRFVQQHLHHHTLIHQLLIVGQIDNTHPAATQLAFHFVAVLKN